MVSLRVMVAAAMLTIAAAAPPPATNSTGNATKTSLKEKVRLGQEACRHIPEYDICHELCLLKSIGASRYREHRHSYISDIAPLFGWRRMSMEIRVFSVDDAGRYVASVAVDYLAIVIPEADRVQAALTQAGEACNTVNDHIVDGCDRAVQVAECLTTRYDNIVNQESRAAKAAAANKTCTNEHDICHKSCVFTSFGVLNDERRINTKAAVDLLAVTYPDLSLYKLENVVQSCGGTGKRFEGCEGASKLSSCFEEKYAKVTGQRT